MAFLSSNSLQDLPIGLGEFAEFVRSRNGPLHVTYATHMTHILEISTTCSTVNFEHFESSCRPTVQLTATGTRGTTGITWASHGHLETKSLMVSSCIASLAWPYSTFDVRASITRTLASLNVESRNTFYSRDKRLARGRGCIVLFANKAL